MFANVETMFCVREKPWHGPGTEVQEAPTSADALGSAKRTWTTKHTENVTSRVHEAHETLMLAERYMSELGRGIDELSKIKLTDKKVMEAFKESVLLFLLRPNSIFPLLVRVPVTSKSRFLKYSTRLLSTLTPISSVVTKITLEKGTSRGGKPYALFNFESVGALTPEETEHVKAYAKQFMEIVNAAQMVPELAEAS